MSCLRPALVLLVSGVCPPRDYESAVRFFAVLDGEDAEELSIGAEEEAVIAESEAEFAGVLALQGLDVTLAGNGKAIEAIENAHGGSNSGQVIQDSTLNHHSWGRELGGRELGGGNSGHST